MKKLIVLMFMLVVASATAQYKSTTVIEVAKGSFSLDSANASGTDSTYILSPVFVIESDTLSFVLELTSSKGAVRYDTLLARPTNRLLFQRPTADSIEALIKIQRVSPNGMADTTAWTNLTTVVTKTVLTGPVVFGTPYAKGSSHLHAKAAILLWNVYPSTKVTGTYKLFIIRKHLR